MEEQQKDLKVEEILKQLAEGNKRLEQEFVVLEDKLYRKKQLSENQHHYRLYIPHSLVQELLRDYHESPLSGHAGIFKTYKRLYEVAYWPGMWTEVKTFIKRCMVCQSLKADNQKPAGKIQQTKVTFPNEMLGIDLMGPLPRSPQRHEYLLVVVDYFTRWVELTPLRTATAQTVARFLKSEIFTRWGVPDYILSDRGRQFVSEVFRELCAQWTVTPKLTTAYHPQTNMTERVNRTLKSMIASYVDNNHAKWDQYLSEFRFAINSAVQETTGVTPAELQIGRKLNSPLDKVLKAKVWPPNAPAYDVVHQLAQLKADVEENIRKSKQRQLRSYNKKRRDVGFRPRQRVWIRNFPQSHAGKKFTAKLARKWKGPYRVVQQLRPLNYRVVLEDTGEDVRTVHVSNLRPFYPTAEDLEHIERKRMQEIFQESSEDEDFSGFLD
uniref:Gypsy retrotransposon integrase-like protein 1 n=1 Tax=Seriola lalandi dorsalis TaxID=1841481 RepID=A0A3B4Z3E1_SERLL